IMEGNPAPPYAQSGLIYPVSDVLSQSVAGNLIPKFLKDGQYQGVNYGIPFTTSTRAMYYNKKIFAAAGISAPPKTWADLQADAAKIKAKGNIGYGMPLGSEEAQAELLLWFLGNGGGYLSAGGKYDINSPQNIATLNFMKQRAAPATRPRSSSSWTSSTRTSGSCSSTTNTTCCRPRRARPPRWRRTRRSPRSSVTSPTRSTTRRWPTGRRSRT